jgi:hypothetical protein
VGAREEHAARAVVHADAVERRRDAVQDRVVERVALGRVGDREAKDAVARPVGDDLAADGAGM